MSIRWLSFALALLAAGCARVVAPQQTAVKLPRPRLAPDAVALDVAFVRLPATDVDGYDSIWTAVDEQPFAADARRDLAENGLRVGIIGQQLPPKLRQLLDAKADPLENRSEDVDTRDSVIGGGQWHWQVRSGVRRKIAVSKIYPTLPVLLREEGQVRGYQLEKAQCVWALKAYPQGDGRVKLDLVPEIEHGNEKSQVVGSEGTWMVRSGRSRLVIDRLRLEAVLSLGESLMISTTPQIKGLGEYFFAETAGGTVERTLVLVRLAQTQYDDLFAPEQASAPLTTPGE